LIQAGSTNYMLNSIWNKEQLPQEWKEFVIASNNKKGYKTKCSNY